MSLRSTQLLVESPSYEAAGNLAAAQAGDDPPNTVAALCRETAIHWRMGHFAQAQRLATAAIEHAATGPDYVDALTLAGACAAALDDVGVGEDYLRRAIDLSRQLGYRAGHALALRYLASHVYLRRGQFDLALATAAEAAHLGPAEQQAPNLLLRAWIYQLTGEQERAREALRALRGTEPDRQMRAAASYLAAQLALDEGDLDIARPLLEEVLTDVEITGTPMLCVSVRIALSRWHRLRGDGLACEWASDAAATARRLGSRFLEGQALVVRGQAAWQAGDTVAAEIDLRRAIATLDGLGAAYDAAHAALLLGALCQQAHRAEAEGAWRDAAQRILSGGYRCLLERERSLVVPLLAAHARGDASAAHAADTLLDELMRVPAAPLHIAGLGRFEVRQGYRSIPAHAWDQRKAGELFRFLLLQPSYSAHRDTIVEALWPGKQQSTAERLLQQATWALRHVLEPELPERFPSRYLTVADHQIALRLPDGSTLDFELFERALYHGFGAPGEELEPTLSLYAGALFPLDRYADWSTVARERLANLYQRGLLCLAERCLTEQRPELARDCCDRIIAQDSWNEDAVKIAMLACLSCGDRPGALRRYETLRRALQADLRLAPRADLRELAESIRSGQ